VIWKRIGGDRREGVGRGRVKEEGKIERREKRKRGRRVVRKDGEMGIRVSRKKKGGGREDKDFTGWWRGWRIMRKRGGREVGGTESQRQEGREGGERKGGERGKAKTRAKSSYERNSGFTLKLKNVRSKVIKCPEEEPCPNKEEADETKTPMTT